MDNLLALNQYQVSLETGTADLAVNTPISFGTQNILNNKSIYAIELVVSDYAAKGKNGNANISATQAKSFGLVVSIVNPGNGQQQQPFDIFPAYSLIPAVNGLQAVRRFNNIVIDWTNTKWVVTSALALSSTNYDISAIFYYR